MCAYMCVCVSVHLDTYMHACVCPCPRVLIISGVIWCDIDPIIIGFCGFYIAAAVGIISGHGLNIQKGH